jgi:hypothetical protein
MVAPDDNWRADDALRDQLVKAQAGAGAFAVAQPANARRQPLEGHLLARHPNPALQVQVLREKLRNGFVVR